MYCQNRINTMLWCYIKSLVENNGIVYDVKGVLPRDIIDGRL